MSPSPVHGFTDPRFARLRDIMAEFLDAGVETGGAVAVTLGGRLVADLWGGHADAARQRPWQRDTLVNVWSVSKGISALAVAILADRGKLDYSQPVARYWPEFAANGKAAITLDTALSHQGGLNGLSVPMDMAGLCAGQPERLSLHQDGYADGRAVAADRRAQHRPFCRRRDCRPPSAFPSTSVCQQPRTIWRPN